MKLWQKIYFNGMMKGVWLGRYIQKSKKEQMLLIDCVMPAWVSPFLIHSGFFFSHVRLVSFAASFSVYLISARVSVFCAISSQNVEDHVAFVITVPTALAIFLAVFILVCIESIFKKLLRVFSLVIWACLVAMGYLFMFSGGIICPWDQVRHVTFSVNILDFAVKNVFSVCAKNFSIHVNQKARPV